jgi:hypothetical protein
VNTATGNPRNTDEDPGRVNLVQIKQVSECDGRRRPMGRKNLGERHGQTIRFAVEDHEVIVRLAGAAGLDVGPFVVETVLLAIEEGRYPQKPEGQEMLPLIA